jgi:hypothetical protein
MTRLPHHISTDDLLASLESAEDVETTEWTNDVPHFLSHFKFEQGTNKVRTSLLYKLYKLYSKAPLRQYDFSVTVSQFIELNNNYFSLNTKPVRIAKVVNTKVMEPKHNVTTNMGIKKHYELFLRNTRVKKGTSWVEGLIFHEIYRHYCIDKKIKSRMSYINFIKIGKLYFTQKRIGSSKAVWFAIDNELVSRVLTDDIIARVNSRRSKTSEKTKQKQHAANIGVPKPKKEKNGKKSKD